MDFVRHPESHVIHSDKVHRLFPSRVQSWDLEPRGQVPRVRDERPRQMDVGHTAEVAENEAQQKRGDAPALLLFQDQNS